MTPEYWQQIRDLFDAAKEMEPAARPAFLAAAHGDVKVCAEVNKLLAAFGQAGNFIERPAAFSLVNLPDPIPEITTAGRRIGPYQTLREIGRGGMGVVWLATRADDAYQKQVAIKLVWPGPESGEVLRRFRQERQILANLEHPNIARMLDGGATEESWPYVVLEYIEGQSITAYCAAHQLGINERLQLFRTVCAAVQYAHQNLVVHRDLKPSNILVTEAGTVKLLDFGIAKLLNPDLSPDDSAATRTGLQLMTPEYASPEQVRGEAITTASDVYSLGVVLYELLTGQRPYQFKSRSLPEIERVICEQELTAPSRSQKSEGGTRNAERANHRPATSDHRPPATALRGDLDNIVLMALRKEARQRYGSVEQLSEDLRRYLAGEAVLARKDTLGYRVGKFVRRHRFGVAATALFILLLMGGLLLTAWQARAARAQARSNRRLLYASQMNLAVQAWESANLTRLRELVEREWLPKNFPAQDTEDLRGFEWYYLWNLYHQNGNTHTLSHPAAVWNAVFSPDGKILASASDDHLIRLWDAENGNELAQLAGHTELVQCVAFSRDGNYLASCSGDRTIKIWEVKTHQLCRTLMGHSERVFGVAFSPDGKVLASCSDDNSWKLWDWQTGQVQTITQAHGNLVRTIAFSPDGRQVITGGDQVPVKLWSAHTGILLSTFLQQGPSSIRAVAISPDGKLLALAGTDSNVQMYDVQSSRLRASLSGHGGIITALAFAPDGKMLATASEDRTVKLWEPVQGRILATLKGHLNQITGVNFSPDSSTIVSTSIDHTVKFWDVRQALQRAYHLIGIKPFSPLAFSPYGKKYLAIGARGLGYLVDPAQVSSVVSLPGHASIISTGAFAPDGKIVATGSSDTNVRLWNGTTGSALIKLSGHTKEITAICFSPSGQTVFTGSDDHTAKLWDVATGQLLQTYQGHLGMIAALAVSPTQDLVATGGADNVIKIWDVKSGKELLSLPAQNNPVFSLGFSADGKVLASGGSDGVVKLWQVATGQAVVSLTGIDGYITALTFSPDGKRLATGSDDGVIRLWDVITGQLMMALTRHKESVIFLTFTPNMAQLISGSVAGEVYFWDAALPNAVGQDGK